MGFSLFCFPQQPYFKSVLLPPSFGSVLPCVSPLQIWALALGGAVSCFRKGGAAGCLWAQSPNALAAVGGPPGNGDQSLEGCLYPASWDHAAGLARCFVRTPETFTALCHNPQQQNLAKAEGLGVTRAPCHKSYEERQSSCAVLPDLSASKKGSALCSN